MVLNHDLNELYIIINDNYILYSLAMNVFTAYILEGCNGLSIIIIFNSLIIIIFF